MLSKATKVLYILPHAQIYTLTISQSNYDQEDKDSDRIQIL